MSSASSSHFGRESGLTDLTRRWMLIAGLTAALTLVGQLSEDLLFAAEQDVRFIFEGNAVLSPKVLQQAASEELKNYRQRGYRRSDIDDAAFQMTVAYRNRGYAFAEVDYRIDTPNGLHRVVFTVSEGPLVILERIAFTGNRAFDAKTLSGFFDMRQDRLIGKGRRLYIKSDVEAARSQIRAYYLDNGFLDVNIAPPEVVFSNDRTSASLNVSIAEGVQYIINTVKVTGDAVPAAEDKLDAIRRELIGQPFTRRKNILLRSRVLNVYKNLGFAFAAVDVTETLDQLRGEVVLDAAVDSGPPVVIAEIDVRGNEDTREGFIRNRMRLKPGQRYSAAKERESFRQLYRTGLFANVTLSLEPTDDRGRAILVVDVEEAPSLEFYVEPGWGSYEKLRLIAGFRERSLFGTGIILNPEGKVSNKAQSLSVRFIDPWFFNTDVHADFPVYYSRRQEPSFKRRDLGLGASFSRELTETWTASTGYNLRRTDLSDVTPDAPDDIQDEDYGLGSIQAQATYDTRNDLFFPTRGRRFFSGVEYADPLLGGDLTFLRLTGGVRAFYRLFSGTVLGMRYKTGLVIPGGQDIGLPISERFFNGGENTVRSYKESQLGPKDLSGEPTGGYGYNVINVELRQRLYKNLIGTLFVDVGNVSPNRSRVEQGLPSFESNSEILSDTVSQFFSGFQTGVGIGIQYLLPIGPLRLDLGYNPNYDPEQDRDEYVLHFSVGTAF